MTALSLLRSLPLGEVLELVDELVDEGADREEAIDAVVEFLDRLLDLGALVPGPAGVALETVDGPLMRAAIGLVVSFAADPDRRAARRSKRAERRAARRARRAERRASRSGGDES